VLDRATGLWRRAVPDDVRPSAVVMLDAAKGGYLPDLGFTPASSAPVTPVEPPTPEPAEALDVDRLSAGFRRWVPLAEHLEDVEREVETLLGQFGDTKGLTASQRRAIALAGRYHDIGKAHPTFQRSLEAAGTPPRPGEVWAKSGSRAALRHQPPHFRHELVGALLLADERVGLLAGFEEPDLVTYLVQAHHGRVRVTVRGKPDEPYGQLLGVVDGEDTLPCPLPGGAHLPPSTISLRTTEFGENSLTARALALRDRLGPFRLAFCEAVLVSADWRASRSYDEVPR
jgi:CRISPR-associated endonuclease/helicase Cas3